MRELTAGEFMTLNGVIRHEDRVARFTCGGRFSQLQTMSRMPQKGVYQDEV